MQVQPIGWRHSPDYKQSVFGNESYSGKADLHGASVAIILGLDSSKTKAVQRRGRVIRVEEGKTAEIFNLVINSTVELEWFKNSHKGDSYITIDEKGLDQVLRGEEPDAYVKPIKRFNFRF